MGLASGLVEDFVPLKAAKHVAQDWLAFVFTADIEFFVVLCRRFVFLAEVKFSQSERHQPALGGGMEEFWGAAVAGSGGNSPVFIKNIQDGMPITFEILELIQILKNKQHGLGVCSPAFL